MKQARRLLPPSSVPGTARIYRWRKIAGSKTLYQHAGGDDGEGGGLEKDSRRTGEQKMNPPMPVIAIPMVIPAAVVVYTEELAFRVVTSKDGLRLLDARSSPIQPKS
ncbi:uncharacterized protein TERG_00735 [Trichophyton rubrum CBS 118892]|uniref:Uncharacterized protein n=1 Tax=Trichophyton rubrum (strain ATCC MYA-4607 / CBS 118892) TaxID=559305 RepID=F2SD35_TRIRC|nr:uncharacterized protein TERG_00735 [Trichophyton rubrum CBS 118892]EGD84457.2 hypothetical protein TERG_00735 [Trichophyton rubrum CBS 118892]